MNKRMDEATMQHNNTIAALQQTAKETQHTLVQLRNDNVAQVASCATLETNHALVLQTMNDQNEVEL